MFENGYRETIERPEMEGFAVPMTPPVVGTVDKSGMVVDPFMPNEMTAPTVVDPFALTPDSKPKPPETPRVAVPTASSLDPNSADFAVPTAANPNFGMYERSAGQYVAPQLQPATDKFKTPYYAAYTNDGDLAGAVMVGQGQGVRLIDNKTGEVVFEGKGPEAAQQAVGLANAVSQDRGRKAAWAIQADYGPEQGWVSQAAERYDPKRQGWLGKLADIVLPIVGGFVAGPIGAAAGSLQSSLYQGRSLKNAAINAALSAGGAYIAPGVTNAVGSALAPAAVQAGAQGALQAGTQAAVQAGTQAAAQGAGTLLSEVVINGVRTLVPAAVAASLGAGAGSLAGGALTSGGGANVAQGGTGPDTLQPPTDVEELIVTGLKNGMSVPDLLALGVPAAAIAALTGGGAGGVSPTTVAELNVTANPTQPIDPLVVAALPAAVAGLSTTLPSTPDKPSLIDKGVDYVKENPLDALGAALLVGAPLLGNSGGKGGSFTVPGGPGTRESLSPVFSAALPAPTFGSRTATPVQVDQRYAIERPEASFFSNVPQAAGPASFAVPSPGQNRTSGIGDLNMDGVMDALDLAIFRKRFGGQGYADGGFAVGEGHGREDKIDARLSDGEYVIDAETVALLGNGSSNAGAKALDDFRVAVRRDKGRDLAEGRISRSARDPFDYMERR